MWDSRTRPGRTLALAGLAALAVSAATGAQAATLTAECLMAKAPPAALDRLVVAYARNGRAGVADNMPRIDPDAIIACAGPADLTPDTARAVGGRAGALLGIASIEYASRAYLADHGSSAPALDDAWRKLGAARREQLRAGYEAMQKNDATFDNDALGAIIVDAAEFAGWTSAGGPDIVLKYGDYFLARAVREDMESR